MKHTIAMSALYKKLQRKFHDESKYLGSTPRI
jgi:hypothetical protein